jgi:uncharacterized protein YecT (DUF1311 family)
MVKRRKAAMQRTITVLYAMKLIALGLSVCLPVLALADPTAPVLGERALREECSSVSFSRVDRHECLERKAANSQMALRQAERKVADALSKWDEEDEYIKEAQAKLAASGREFIRYRKAHCEFNAALGAGRIGANNSLRNSCLAELNNRRATQLLNVTSYLLPKGSPPPTLEQSVERYNTEAKRLEIARAASAAPVLDARALSMECSMASLSMADNHECLQKKAADSQKTLRKAQKKVTSALSQWKQEDKYIKEAKTRLAASSRAFARYRKAHREFYASLGAGKVGTNSLRHSCIAEFNNRRAAQLLDAVSDMPLKPSDSPRTQR